MKRRIAKVFTAICLTVVLLVGSIVTASAANNPFAAMEAQSRRAVEAAIQAGTVPSGTTIFDCRFGADASGAVTVIAYRDRSGNWIDVTTRQPMNNPPAAPGGQLTRDRLTEYAAELFRLANEAREQAGLAPLIRDAELDRAAAIRAEELSRDFSHTRPDGTRFFTVFGVEQNFNYGENIGTSISPENQITRWLNSEGHRSNILDTHRGYTSMGIAVYQDSNGNLYWCQLFYRPTRTR